MTDLCPIPIGNSGKTFILSLFNVTLGLCAELAGSISRQGSCYGILAAGTSRTRAENFTSGGVIQNQTRSDWLAQRIAAYANEGCCGVILVQDLWCGLPDHRDDPPKTDWFAIDDQVYAWAEFGGGCAPDVDLLLRQPMISYGLAAFLIKDAKLAASLKAGKGNVKEIAADVMELYVPAYDDESFVMWAR